MVGKAPIIELVRVTAIATANKLHAVTSSTAAQVRASVPNFVFCKLCSVIILASTGNAVIDIAAPKNKAKAVNETLLFETIGYSSSASKLPKENGTRMLTWEVKIAISKLFLRYLGFSSKPIKNMKNISPTSDSTLRKGTASAGKSAAAVAGATKPKSEGPSIIPATISPMT